ncbi:hypothetical protein N2152v2_003072 [Parachlorella kessleri]
MQDGPGHQHNLDADKEGRRRERPFWRSKPSRALDAQQEGNSSAIEGFLPEHRDRPRSKAVLEGKGGPLRVPGQQQLKEQHGSLANHSSLPGQRIAGSAGPPPPPGLSLAPAQPTNQQPHPYRLGQAQAEAAVALAATASQPAGGSRPRRSGKHPAGGAGASNPAANNVVQAEALLQSSAPAQASGRRQRPKGGVDFVPSPQLQTGAAGQGRAPLPGFQSGGFLAGELQGITSGPSSGRGAGRASSSAQRSKAASQSGREGAAAPTTANGFYSNSRGSKGGRGGGNAPDSGLGVLYHPLSVGASGRPTDIAGPPLGGRQQGGHGRLPQQGFTPPSSRLQQQQQRAEPRSGRRPVFAEHLSQAELQRGLKSGVLFKALFRCNAADRTQGFCTVAGLPSDVFVKGYKSQNRAMEGDEVVIRILPPDQWYQMLGKQGSQSPQQRQQQAAVAQAKAAEPGVTGARQQQQEQRQQQQEAPTTPVLAARDGVRGSIVRAEGLTARGVATGDSPEAGPAMTPPAWAGVAPPLAMGDLLASPALQASGSGGDLAFSLGPAPLREGASGASSEEGKSVALTMSESNVGSSVAETLSDEEKEMVLEDIEESMQGLTLEMDPETGQAERAAAGAEQQVAPPKKAAAGSACEAEGGAGQMGEGGVQRKQASSAQQMQPRDAVGSSSNGDSVSMVPAGVGGGASANGAGSSGASMLDFVLTQTPLGAGASASHQAQALAPAPFGYSAAKSGCWHAGDSPEASLQAVIERLGGMPGWRATGEVVAVVQPSRRRDSVIGVLKQEGDSETGMLLLIPCDPRLPRMLVRSAQLPQNLKLKLKQEAACAELSSRTLVSAHVVGWEPNHMFPLAQVRESLGQAGELASETKALLEAEQVKDDDQFTPEVLACLPPTPWAISEDELERRRDFRGRRVFSIDPPSARDLDDALSVEKLEDGLLRVGVHIADVSHFVGPGTALDKEAQQRSTSVYLVDRVIPMLPRLLCEELCRQARLSCNVQPGRLNPGVDRLSFSIVWDMTEEGDIRSTWVGRSVIRTCGKLAYPMVQSMIEGKYLARPGEEPPCQLNGDHSWPEVVGDSLTLHRIARNLRRRRYDNGALRLDNVRLYFQLDDDGNPDGYGVYEQREANQLVEEFMLLANMTAARMVAEAFPDRALLRCHPPPNQHKMGELSQLAAELGFPLDVSSSGALQESLAALRSAAGDDAVIDIITLLATKPMQVARYFCTGETPDEAYWRHYALAVSHYTHFTSPIRRYPDIVVHRLLAAAIDAQGTQEQRAARHGLREAQEVGMVSAHANDRKLAAKAVQDGSLRLYLCVMLHRQPLVCKGVVMAVGGSRFFDVYLPVLGVDVRVHTNSVLKGGEGALTSTWEPQIKQLTLTRSVSAPADRQSPDDQPDYFDIPNLDKLKNPQELAPLALPLVLRMLTHVRVVVSSWRSATSGSPTHVFAKLWVE